MKKLIYSGIIAIASTLFLSAIPATHALTESLHNNLKATHIDNSSSGFNSYRIDIHVKGNELSTLVIDLPENLSVNSIEVSDTSGKRIEATPTISGKKIEIVFLNPIASNTNLQVHLIGASRRWNNTNPLLIPVTARLVGIGADIPLGFARIQTFKSRG